MVQIRKFLGMGQIMHISYQRVRKGGKKSSDQVCFRVLDKQNMKLVLLFRKYPLRTSKHLDFECWAKAVELFCAGNHFAMQSYKKELEEIRRLKKLESMDTPIIEGVSYHESNV
jgi:hypothetical protein